MILKGRLGELFRGGKQRVMSGEHARNTLNICTKVTQ
jgi:hypothetical protein